jgi:hypothetical protein
MAGSHAVALDTSAVEFVAVVVAEDTPVVVAVVTGNHRLYKALAISARK